MPTEYMATTPTATSCFQGYGILLMVRSFTQLHSTPINLTVDSNYIKWVSNYPAVIVCEKAQTEPLYEDVTTFVNIPPDVSYTDAELSKYVAELVFFNSELSELRRCNDQEHWARPPEGAEMEYGWRKNKNACEMFRWNITKFARLRRGCHKIFQKCMWNDEEFDCCEQFVKLHTIYGVCYAWNSIAALKTDLPVRTAKSNDMAMMHLYFKVVPDAYSTFVVSREESLTHRFAGKKNLFPGLVAENSKVGHVYVRIKNIANDAAVRNIPLEIRKCRFPDESNLAMSKIYSYSACMVEQLAQKQLELCKCTQYYLPEYADPKLFCNNLADVLCLSDMHKQMQMSLNVTKCMVSCVESEVTILGATRSPIPEDIPEEEKYNSAINIRFQAMRIRYHRRVMRDTIELIVNLGGIATLFFGASVLSIVEMIYYFLIYPWNPRVDMVKFDVKNLMKLPKDQRREVLSYVGFKEKVINDNRMGALYPFRK